MPVALTHDVPDGRPVSKTLHVPDARQRHRRCTRTARAINGQGGLYTQDRRGIIPRRDVWGAYAPARGALRARVRRGTSTHAIPQGGHQCS